MDILEKRKQSCLARLRNIGYDPDESLRSVLTAGNILHISCLLGISRSSDYVIEDTEGRGTSCKMSVVSFIRHNRRDIPKQLVSQFADRMNSLLAWYAADTDIAASTRLSSLRTLIAGICYMRICELDKTGMPEELLVGEIEEFDKYFDPEYDSELLDTDSRFYSQYLYPLISTLCSRRIVSDMSPLWEKSKYPNEQKPTPLEIQDHCQTAKVISAFGPIKIVVGAVRHRELLSVLAQEYTSGRKYSYENEQQDSVDSDMAQQHGVNTVLEHFRAMRAESEFARAYRIYNTTIIGASKQIKACFGSDYKFPHEEFGDGEQLTRRAGKAYIAHLMSISEVRLEEFIDGLYEEPVSIRGGDRDDMTVLLLILVWNLFCAGGADMTMNIRNAYSKPVMKWIIPQLIMWFRQMAVYTSARGTIKKAVDDVQLELDGKEGWVGVNTFDKSQSAAGTVSNLFWLTFVLMESARLYGFALSSADNYEENILMRLGHGIYDRYSMAILSGLSRMPEVMLPARTDPEKGRDITSLYVHQSFRLSDPYDEYGAAGETETYTYDNIFSAMQANERGGRVLLAVSHASGWGKTTLLRALACNYAFPSYRSVIAPPELAADAPIAHAGFMPLYIRVTDIASQYVMAEKDGGDFRTFLSTALNRTIKKYSNRFTTEDVNELTSYMFPMTGELPDGRAPLLLIDGLEDFVNIVDQGQVIMPRDRMRERFVELLLSFLAHYKNCSCIVTTTPDSGAGRLTERKKPIAEQAESLESGENAENKEPKESIRFATIVPMNMTTRQINDYGEKWLKLCGVSADGKRFFASGDAGGDQAEGGRSMASQFETSFAARWLVRRPLFLNYVFATMTLNNPFMPISSPYQIVKKLSEELVFTRTPGRALPLELIMCESREILAPASLIAYFMFRGGDVHITKEKLKNLVEDSREALKDCLPASSFIMSCTSKDFIDNVLRQLMIVKFEDNGSNEDFSFSSRPLLWFFASMAIVNGYVLCENRNVTGESLVRGFKEIIAERKRDRERFDDQIEDFIYTTAYVAYAAGPRGEQLINYICECAADPSVGERYKRIICAQMISHLITLNPDVTNALREKMYRMSFMYFFYIQQINDVWSILRSRQKNDYLGYISRQFVETANGSDATSCFPRFCWMIGYIDWLKLAGCYDEKYRDLLPEQTKCLTGLEQWLWEPALEKLNGRKPNAVELLLDYIEKEFGRERERAQKKPRSAPNTDYDLIGLGELDEGKLAEEESRNYLRVVLMLSNYFWLLNENTSRYRMDHQDDVALFENMVVLDGGLSARCVKVFKMLLDLSKGSVANMACYAWHSLIKSGKGSSAELCDADVCRRIVRVDYAARVAKIEKCAGIDAKVWASLDRLEKVSQPLCGALRLLCVLETEQFMTVLEQCKDAPADDELDEMRAFYRGQFERYYRAAIKGTPIGVQEAQNVETTAAQEDDKEYSDSSDDLRHAAMMLKAGLLIGAWSGEPDGTRKVCTRFMNDCILAPVRQPDGSWGTVILRSCFHPYDEIDNFIDCVRRLAFPQTEKPSEE